MHNATAENEARPNHQRQGHRRFDNANGILRQREVGVDQPVEEKQKRHGRICGGSGMAGGEGAKRVVYAALLRVG